MVVPEQDEPVVVQLCWPQLMQVEVEVQTLDARAKTAVTAFCDLVERGRALLHGGGSLRPLVEIASAPKFGWYTVQIAQFAGVPTTGDFTLKYGRYTAGNPNFDLTQVSRMEFHGFNPRYSIPDHIALDNLVIIPEPTSLMLFAAAALIARRR